LGDLRFARPKVLNVAVNNIINYYCCCCCVVVVVVAVVIRVLKAVALEEYNVEVNRS